MLKPLAVSELRKPCCSLPGSRRHTHFQIGHLQLEGSKVHWYLNTREDTCTSARNNNYPQNHHQPQKWKHGMEIQVGKFQHTERRKTIYTILIGLDKQNTRRGI